MTKTVDQNAQRIYIPQQGDRLLDDCSIICDSNLLRGMYSAPEGEENVVHRLVAMIALWVGPTSYVGSAV